MIFGYIILSIWLMRDHGIDQVQRRIQRLGNPAPINFQRHSGTPTDS